MTAIRDVKDEWPRQLFRALQGHKEVAGGNAPGKREARSATLKGAHYLGP
jgi:hypothetical protein